MDTKRLHTHISVYRYEILLAALLLLIFDKIFFPDNIFYVKYVWPLNMILISIASFGVFVDHNRKVNAVRNILSLLSISMPFCFLLWGQYMWFRNLLAIFFILFYSFIFVAIMYQMTMTKEVRINIIIGSFCGYLLLSMMALFSYLWIEMNFPDSFHGITAGRVDLIYNELSYFSFITLTSIGFGDIYPHTDMSRLVTAFYGMAGQFYMVAVVGIIISKFTSKN